MRFLRYSIWPIIKVRFRYWWWIIKYRGKKNIPPDVVFSALQESAQKMADNLKRAFSAMPSNTGSEEVRKIIEAMRGGSKIQEKVEALRRNEQKNTEQGQS
ncbi:MAG: hypothetical protein NUV53_02550 [Patescibacteria group bacterium]|nr:hypothetical protein [Patescibacteria group bacterium]